MSKLHINYAQIMWSFCGGMAYDKENLEGLEQFTAALQACTTKEDFLHLATGKYHTHFQWDRYGEREYISMPFGKGLHINYYCILILLEGKIMMEAWGEYLRI